VSSRGYIGICEVQITETQKISLKFSIDFLEHTSRVVKEIQEICMKTNHQPPHLEAHSSWVTSYNSTCLNALDYHMKLQKVGRLLVQEYKQRPLGCSTSSTHQFQTLLKRFSKNGNLRYVAEYLTTMSSRAVRNTHILQFKRTRMMRYTQGSCPTYYQHYSDIVPRTVRLPKAPSFIKSK
jgi:hypothetical protein